MKRSLRIIIGFFMVWTLLFAVAKCIFMMTYHNLYAGIGIGDIAAVLWHGLKMDLATAGYLTALPALITVAGPWIKEPRYTRIALKVYAAIISLLVIAILGVDTVLYGYWDFKLDITPLFYVTTDPTAALASVSTWTIIAGVAGLIAGSWLLYLAIVKVSGIDNYAVEQRRRLATSGVLLLVTALLFIPIRGGMGVSTINLSSVYYSNNMRLNHAAVNPAFSLMYSATHQQAFNKMFRLIDPAEAEAIIERITASTPTDSITEPLLNTTRPDIYIIILESFSNNLFESLGGEPIATGLDSIAQTGYMFSNLYASSFRTDRALPVVLNGFPAQPTTSLFKLSEKARHIPSLANALSAVGYAPHYYYGGDPGFANKQTFLMSTGYTDIISEGDFDSSIPRSKWGVPDGPLFDRALNDVTADTATRRLNIIQTLSSHEPFEVPYTNPRFAHDAPCNAFAYTDSCATAFINHLASIPAWDNALVIMVADHYGCYPHNPAPDDVITRHRIPLILCGGALARHGIDNRVASQTDIAATLLNAMDIDSSDFSFSRNLFSPDVERVAFMSTPTYTATVDSTGVASIYSIERKLFSSGTPYPSTTADSINAAYLQTIYDTLYKL
ncbi:MAG: sulfatase-like hydrolase/transferase [Bacteroides sp.]|nr:sulfatase-like hydrolase/transferase [Bacteroides sp.]